MSFVDLRLFAGQPVRIDDDGQFSAIWKRPVTGRVRILREGLVGDAQADRRVHGGPEKAVHHYPGENYAKLAVAFPQAAAALVVGSLGENLSTLGGDEAAVCIGDLYRAGSALLQVSQPRRPCWKIDRRFGVQGMTAYVAESGCTGWYYRVIEEGEVASGDGFALVERPAGAVTLAELWSAWQVHRPDAERLAACARAPGLTEAWVTRIGERLRWLRENT